MSSFDPDTNFMPDVFSRLEAVMDTEIISLFTKELVKLFSASCGVKLSPQILVNSQHVDNVLYEWCEGRGHRPPT